MTKKERKVLYEMLGLADDISLYIEAKYKEYKKMPEYIKRLYDNASHIGLLIEQLQQPYEEKEMMEMAKKKWGQA